jgi:hypothetical protein
MKKITLILFCAISLNIFAQEKQFNWKTSFEEASLASKNQNKPILVFFTNQQDSESLKTMRSDFFGTDTFKMLSDKMILLFVDASERNTSISADQKMRNQRMIIHYNKSNAFPAVMALDFNGKVLGESLTQISKQNISNYFTFLGTITN